MATQLGETTPGTGATAKGDGAPVIVLLGAFGGIMPSLQPLLLGELGNAGRISAAAVGQFATAEALSMALAVTLAGMVLPTTRLRPVAIAALLSGIVANLATGVASPTALVALRVLAGAGAGLLLWLLLSLLARSDMPARVTGWYVVVQGIAALALSGLISGWLVPHFGVAGGYAALAALGLALLPAVGRMPAGFAPLADAPAIVWPTSRGMIGLAIAGLQLAGIMAFWVYVLPVGRALGYSADTIRLAISCAIAAQIGAGLAATRFAALPARAVVAACLFVGVTALLAIVAVTSPILFGAALIAFSFVWVFVLGYHVPLVADFDTSKKSVMALTGLQLAGVAAGPALSSLLLPIQGDLIPVIVAIALLAAAGTILALDGILTRKFQGQAQLQIGSPSDAGG